jgi:hypothetical protein
MGGIFYWGKLKPAYLGDKVVDGRILLKWILKKQDMRMWTRFIWHRTGSSGGLL